MAEAADLGMGVELVMAQAETGAAEAIAVDPVGPEIHWEVQTRLPVPWQNLAIIITPQDLG